MTETNHKRRRPETETPAPAEPAPPPKQVHVTPRQAILGVRHAALQTIVATGGAMDTLANMTVKDQLAGLPPGQRPRMEASLLAETQTADAALRVFLQADHWLSIQPIEEEASAAEPEAKPALSVAPTDP